MKVTRAVLFDMDGVLVLTEPLKAEAHASAVKRFGGDVCASFYSKVMGQTHEAVRSAFLGATQICVPLEEYDNAFRRIYQELLRHKIEITPGVLPLTDRLRKQGYRLAVVSSSSSPTMHMILNRTGLAEVFHADVSADDVQHGKPAAEPYVLALDRLSVSSSSAATIEDSEAGVQSAIDAGIPVLALHHALNRSHDFSRAYAILDSLVDTDRIVALIDSMVRSDAASHAVAERNV